MNSYLVIVFGFFILSNQVLGIGLGTDVKEKDIFNFHTKLNGHWAFHAQNFSLYPIENPRGYAIITDNIMKFMTLKPNMAIKIMTIETKPQLMVERYPDGFTIHGPLYSLIVEAAKLINYRYYFAYN